MEAVPNVFILLIMYFRDYTTADTIIGEEKKNFLGLTGYAMFCTTFSISVFSASVGIAKFLKMGPCQIVPSDKWNCGFFLLFLSVAFSLLGKGCVLAFTLETNKNDFVSILAMWMCTCLMPQVILVSRAM